MLEKGSALLVPCKALVAVRYRVSVRQQVLASRYLCHLSPLYFPSIVPYPRRTVAIDLWSGPQKVLHIFKNYHLGNLRTPRFARLRYRL